MSSDILDKSKMKYVGLFRKDEVYFKVYQLENGGYHFETLNAFNYGGECK